jgi:hypothetical protein
MLVAPAPIAAALVAPTPLAPVFALTPLAECSLMVTFTRV